MNAHRVCELLDEARSRLPDEDETGNETFALITEAMDATGYQPSVLDGPYVRDDGTRAAWTAVHAMVNDDPIAVAAALGNWCDDTGNDDYKFLFWAIAHEPGDGTFDPEVEDWVRSTIVELLIRWGATIRLA